MSLNNFHADLLAEAIALGRKSLAIDRYRVGAIVTDPAGRLLATGYTGELFPSCHAEESAIIKCEKAGIGLSGARLYSSMEPCTDRKSSPESCTEMIIRHGFSQVVFAYREPDILAYCDGAERLSRAGITVVELSEMAGDVVAANAHILIR